MNRLKGNSELIVSKAGAGKTRYIIGEKIYPELLNKKNVLFITGEQTTEELDEMLLSKYVYDNYKLLATEDTVWDTFKNELNCNSRYGKFKSIEVDPYRDDFLDYVTNEIKTTKYDLVVIEYIGLLNKFTNVSSNINIQNFNRMMECGKRKGTKLIISSNLGLDRKSDNWDLCLCEVNTLLTQNVKQRVNRVISVKERTLKKEVNFDMKVNFRVCDFKYI